MRGETLPDFAQTAVKEIDDQLRVLKDEASRLEAARAALTGARRRVRRPARNGVVRALEQPTSRRNDGAVAPKRRGGNTRADQALELVREKPGITIPEIAHAMKIQPNYLYRVLPRLASGGQVKRDGQGWHPASLLPSTPGEPVRNVPRRKQTRAAKPKPAASATRAAGRTRRSGESTSSTNGRTTPGATKASVLAALASGEAMTAGQVAAKAGLARPTVSTTLSKLAKTAEIQKAERGYRLASKP
jgi:DNA-binding IscR family transcriptional regulator